MRLIKAVTVLAGIVLLLAVSTSVGVQWTQQMSLARQYEKQGRFEDALKIYIELRAERPEDVELMARIQGVYKELKRYPQLIEFLNHRLDKSPGNLDLHMALGEVFFLSGQVRQARETWLEAIRLSPGKEISYLRVGRAFWERGMLAEAEEVFLRGRKVLSDKTLFAESLARIYELGAD
ncbi:tetratricopeptide repeat protein, partial [bacterium]|nr:tetratricopeptide repeat protein [bacterium]